MKTAGIIYTAIHNTLRKTRSGALRHSEVELAINVGIKNFFEKQLKLFRASGFIPAPLEPLIKVANNSLIGGEAALPYNFAKEVTFYVKNVNATPAEFLNMSEFIDRQTSVILPPTEENPIGNISGGVLYVRPVSLTSIVFVYIAKPVDVVVGITVNGRNWEYDTTNNESSTTDTEFRVEYAPDIIKEALAFLSVSEQDEGAASLSTTVNG